MKMVLGQSEIYQLTVALRANILQFLKDADALTPTQTIRVYGVPRGGVPVAYMLSACQSNVFHFLPVDSADEADIIVDDLIDSGRTRDKWSTASKLPFFALVDKFNSTIFKGKWIVFPWEGGEAEPTGIEDNIVRILQYIGEDPDRGGLKETPARVARAFQSWFDGYAADIPALLKTFEDGVCDEMVLVKDIPFYSHCEHHMAPFFGTATVGYIPSGKIVGLSKLSRVVDAFARRLQVQERMTVQIAEAIYEHLKPQGVGVIVKARHLCMESRGVCQQGHHTVTNALLGVMRTTPEARAEFLALAR